MWWRHFCWLLQFYSCGRSRSKEDQKKSKKKFDIVHFSCCYRFEKNWHLIAPKIMPMEKPEIVMWSNARILEMYQKPLISIHDEIEYLCSIWLQGFEIIGSIKRRGLQKALACERSFFERPKRSSRRWCGLQKKRKPASAASDEDVCRPQHHSQEESVWHRKRKHRRRDVVVLQVQ